MATNEVRYKFTAEDSQFKKITGNVQSELKKMAKDGTLGIAALSGAFIALGKSMQDTLNTMDQISKMSSKTGFSTESLSALKYAADLSGISLESLEKSFIKLSKSVDSNSPAFAKLNINIKDSNGTLKSNEDILMDVADAFSGMEDGANKTAIATEIFGKAGADMIPLLNGGSDAIRAQMQEAENLGITFDTVSAKKAERFNDSITTLTYTAKGFTQELVLALTPAIDSLSGKFEDASGKSTDLKDKLSPIQAVARGIAMGFTLVADGVILLGHAYAVVAGVVWDAIKLVGAFGKASWQALTGDFTGAMTTMSEAMNNPFSKSSQMLDALKAKIGSMKNDILNIAWGTTTYGMTDAELNAYVNSTMPKGGASTSEETTGGTKSNAEKTKAIDATKAFEQSKKDALEVIEKSWSEWQLENDKATASERLRAYRDYLLQKQTLLRQFQGSEDFGNLSAGDQASANTELIKLTNELSDLNFNFKKIDESIFGKTPLGAFGTSTDIAKIFGLSPEQINEMQKGKLSDKAKSFISSTQNLRDQNPKYELSIFDSLDNQRKNNTAKYNQSSGNLTKEWLSLEKEMDAEIQRLLDSGLTKENSAVVAMTKLKEDSYKSYLDTKLQLDKNYADATTDIEQQTQETKFGIISNALGSIGALFAKHTLMYKALAIAQAIMDTYAAATKALLLPAPWGEIQMAATIAQGMANVAEIVAVEVPAYAKGGLVTQPQLSLLGESGAEFVAPQRDFMSYTQQIIRTVENERFSSGFVGTLKLKGNDLAVAVERASAVRGRLGV